MGSYQDELAAKRARDFQAKLQRDEERMHPVYRLRFDGKSLNLFENNKQLQSWPAVSGRADRQNPGYQKEADIGPIPQGLYRMSAKDIQEITLKDNIVGIGVNAITEALDKGKSGAWPGGEISWGTHRVFLKPDINTKTFGRDNFSIHGGWSPGSAGCIDLTDHIEEFSEIMRAIPQGDVDVIVDYDTVTSPNHRPRLQQAHSAPPMGRRVP